VGAAMAVVLVVIALAAPLIAPYDPIALTPKDRLLPPSAAHFFGTDDGGRDVFSRVVYGARLSLLAAAVVLSVAIVVGTTVGLVAGYGGGAGDETLLRLTDMFLAFPALVLAMGVSAALGPSLINAMLAIAVVWWPWSARLVRGQTLRLKHEAFVAAARASGASTPWILARH